MKTALGCCLCKMGEGACLEGEILQQSNACGAADVSWLVEINMVYSAPIVFLP